METIKPKSKKITINLATLRGLGETIRKIKFHKEKLVGLTECAEIQYQEIMGVTKNSSKELAE